jgi:hypothetical protein
VGDADGFGAHDAPGASVRAMSGVKPGMLYAWVDRGGATILVSYDEIGRMFRASAPGWGACPSVNVETTINEAVYLWEQNGRRPCDRRVWGAIGMREVGLDYLIAAVKAVQS